MLEFHPVTEQGVEPARLVELLQEFKAVLAAEGMASMDEYGDMLSWSLPRKGNACRTFHVFHPGFCSYSDAYRGTIHFHGGEIRGTILVGHAEHYTYRPQQHPDGDRFFGGDAYKLTKHTHEHGEGTQYTLPAMVPHWLKPTRLTLTYFEEDDNEIMGDLLNPVSDATDEHVWEQPDAEAMREELVRLVEERIDALTLLA